MVQKSAVEYSTIKLLNNLNLWIECEEEKGKWSRGTGVSID